MKVQVEESNASHSISLHIHHSASHWECLALVLQCGRKGNELSQGQTTASISLLISRKPHLNKESIV